MTLPIPKSLIDRLEKAEKERDKYKAALEEIAKDLSDEFYSFDEIERIAKKALEDG